LYFANVAPGSVDRLTGLWIDAGGDYGARGRLPFFKTYSNL